MENNIKSLFEFCRVCSVCRGDGCNDCGGIGEIEVFATAETVLRSSNALLWVPVGSSSEVAKYFTELFALGIKYGAPQIAVDVARHFAWVSGAADNVTDVEEINSRFFEGAS